MNRNCLFNKAIALLLCAFMLVGFLPSTVFTAAADEFVRDDHESDPDIWEGTTEEPTEEPAPGSTAETAIPLTALENSLTVEAGATVYYQGQFSGMNMAVTGTTGYNIIIGEEITADVEGTFSTAVVTEDPRYPFVFAIQNNTAEAVKYSVNFTYPEGSMDNPEEIGLARDYETAIAAGSQGYYYSYPADYDGLLQVSISTAEGLGWHYFVNNLTTSAYGEHQYSNSDPVVNPYELEVTTGDEILIFVNTFDPENEFTAPEGNVTVRVEYKPGSAANPIMLQKLENTVTVPAGETVYYQGNFSGMNMAVNGNGTVIYGEQEIDADGTKIPVSSPNPRMPVTFAIMNEGETDAEFTVNFTHPVGTQGNPAVAQLGDNVAAFVDATGEYYWNYTAAETGNLIVGISSDDGNWQYTINNKTKGTYGDTQWNDSDPVVNPATVEVTEGDVIEIKVIPYDPADMWNIPDATITVNLAYEVQGPAVDENLGFYRTSETVPYASLMLGNEIKISVNVATYQYNYDEYYVEFVINYNNGKTTKALPSANSDEYYGNFQYAVPAPLMTETIFATVYGIKDGVTYCGETVSFTVRDSIIYRLDNAYSKYTTNDVAKRQFDMLIHMLKYGEEAQNIFRINQDKLATVGVNEDYLAKLKTDVPTYNTPNFTANSSLYLYNIGLKLQEKINFYGNFLFYSGFTKIEDYSVEIEHTKSDGSTVNYIITSENGGLKWDGSYYLTFDLNEIAPSQMRDQLKITLYQNGVAVTETYSATGDTATASTNAALRNAVLNFADCAKAYFG